MSISDEDLELRPDTTLRDLVMIRARKRRVA